MFAVVSNLPGGIIPAIAPKDGCWIIDPCAACELCETCASVSEADMLVSTVISAVVNVLLEIPVGEGFVVLFRCHHVSSSFIQKTFHILAHRV